MHRDSQLVISNFNKPLQIVDNFCGVKSREATRLFIQPLTESKLPQWSSACSRNYPGISLLIRWSSFVLSLWACLIQDWLHFQDKVRTKGNQTINANRNHPHQRLATIVSQRRHKISNAVSWNAITERTNSAPTSGSNQSFELCQPGSNSV